jgi:hypothetical protein
MPDEPAPRGQWEPFRLDRAYIWRQVKINIVAIVSVIVRRARLAGMNGPAYTLPSGSTPRVTSTRGKASVVVSCR